MLSPDTGLIVWQLFVFVWLFLFVVSWVLSVLIISRGARTRDSKLLLFGAISLCVPLLMTLPYFIFYRRQR